MIYRLTATGMVLVGSTGGATSNETASFVPVAAGATYRVFVHGFETDGPDADYTLFYWIVSDAAAGNLTVTGPGSVTAGSTHTIQVDWSGLTPGIKYLGTITHHRLAAPVPAGAPQIAPQTVVFIDVPPATTAVPDE